MAAHFVDGNSEARNRTNFHSLSVFDVIVICTQTQYTLLLFLMLALLVTTWPSNFI
jgi:hypothetical protein